MFKYSLFAMVLLYPLVGLSYDSTSLVDTNNTSTSTSTVNSNSTNNNNNNNVNTTAVQSNATNTNVNTSTGTNTNYSYGEVTNNNNNATTSTNTNNNNNTNTSTGTNTNFNYGTVTTNTNNNSSTNSNTTSDNRNVNQNISTNQNVNKTDQNVNSTNSNYNNSDVRQKIESPPPTAIAPSMMSGGNLDLCTTGVSGAVQTQILGVSGGGTVRDLNCERLKLAKYLYDMGMKVAAVSTLCQDRRVYDAMINAGTPCPINGEIGEQAKVQWANNKDKIPEEEKSGFQLRLLWRIYHLLF